MSEYRMRGWEFESCPPIDFDKYRSLSIKDKIPYLEMGGRIFHVLYAEQFHRKFLDEIYHLTNKIRLISKTKEGAQRLGHLLAYKKAMLYFGQPSTRTYLSFLTACQNLGIFTADVRNLEISSEVKGESKEDTMRTFSSYFDFIIMRSLDVRMLESASYLMRYQTKRPIPMINAGVSTDEHPTQGLLDYFTLRKSLSRFGYTFKGRTLLFTGDLKRSRCIHSLCTILSQYTGLRIIFSSIPELQIPDIYVKLLEKAGMECILTDQWETYLKQADVLYMTRFQKEYNQTDSLTDEDIKRLKTYALGKNNIKYLKSTAVVLHPLPRNQELSHFLDTDPRVMIWRQVRNGMWIRTALIAYLFFMDNDILGM